MPGQPRYYLKKTDRLSGRKKVDAVFSNGNSFSLFPFRVLWLPENEHKEVQAGFGVSVRHFKKATERNRIKRMMREAYRLQKNKLSQILEEKGKRLSVFILFTGNEIPPYKLVHEKMNKVIERLMYAGDEKGK